MIKRSFHVKASGAVLLALALGLTGCGGGGRAGSPPAQRDPGQGSPQVVLSSSPDLATPGAAQVAGGQAGTITTVATGTVTGAPDTLMIGVGVSTTGTHASSALADNNSLAAKVQQALRSDGVAASDIQTTGLSLQQAYPKSDGFQVFDEVTATVRDLSRAGAIIDDALAQAGDSGRLEMVNFSMSSTDPFMSRARQSAMAAAKADAEQLAAAAGRQLGALVSATEQLTPTYAPYGGMGVASPAAGSASAAPAVPIQPGTQKVTVTVTTVWAIGS